MAWKFEEGLSAILNFRDGEVKGPLVSLFMLVKTGEKFKIDGEESYMKFFGVRISLYLQNGLFYFGVKLKLVVPMEGDLMVKFDQDAEKNLQQQEERKFQDMLVPFDQDTAEQEQQRREDELWKEEQEAKQ